MTDPSSSPAPAPPPEPPPPPPAPSAAVSRGKTTRRDTTYTDRSIAAGDGQFVNCTFSRVEITGNVSEASFSRCTFVSVVFSSGLEDATFDACRLRDVRFVGRVADCTFVDVTFDASCGTWHALRSVFLDCRFDRAKYRKHAQWTRCRLTRCRFDQCLLDTSVWCDTVCASVALRQSSLARAVVSRCRFTRCTFGGINASSAAWAGNTWRDCTARDLNEDYSTHVAESVHDQHNVRASARHAKWTRCTFARGRHEHADWQRSTWQGCAHEDSTWSHVKMQAARVIGTAYTNIKQDDVDDTDTSYRNVTRAKEATACGVLHFVGNSSAVKTRYAVTLYSHHHRTSTTHDRVFRLRRSRAVDTDFVYVLPVPGWFTFGFSTPRDAHHLVTHVTLGDAVFTASTTPYRDVTSGIDMLGYRRVSRPRARSF